MSSFTVKLLSRCILFPFLITLSTSFSPNEWSNDQLPIYNQRSNDFRFKSRLESTRNSYGTKLSPSESSNYQPIIANIDSGESNQQPLIGTSQQNHPKNWPDPFDPQPHVPIPIGSNSGNDFLTPKRDIRLPLNSPNIQPMNANYQSPNEGELGTPRPKKEKMTVDEIFLGVFSPVPFNGTWLSDHELIYHDSSNNLVLLNLRNDSVSLLVPNTTFVSIA